MLVAVIFFGSLIALVILCRMIIVKRCPQSVVRVLISVERKLIFNSVLRAMLESYLQMAILMLYGWRNRRVTPDTQSRIDFLILLALTIYITAFPFLQFRFLNSRRERVQNDQALAQSYGSLYQNIEVSKYTALAFTLAFLLRRLAFAYTICHIDRTITF